MSMKEIVRALPKKPVCSISVMSDLKNVLTSIDYELRSRGKRGQHQPRLGPPGRSPLRARSQSFQRTQRPGPPPLWPLNT